MFWLTSAAGRISLEGNGAYSMSKHALVAYTNTLRLEMKKWGVTVSIVEPTGYSTGKAYSEIKNLFLHHIFLKSKHDPLKGK